MFSSFFAVQKEGGTQLKLIIDYPNDIHALFKPMRWVLADLYLYIVILLLLLLLVSFSRAGVDKNTSHWLATYYRNHNYTIIEIYVNWFIECSVGASHLSVGGGAKCSSIIIIIIDIQQWNVRCTTSIREYRRESCGMDCESEGYTIKWWKNNWIIGEFNGIIRFIE